MKTLDDVVREHTLFALWLTNNNKAKAAKLLGVSRRKVHRLLHRHKIPLNLPRKRVFEAFLKEAV